MELKTHEIKTVLCPVFAPAKKIRELFGLSRTTLNKLVDAGHVRRKKTGDGASNGVLYCVADIYEWFTSED